MGDESPPSISHDIPSEIGTPVLLGLDHFRDAELAKRSSSLAARFYLAQALSIAGRNREATEELEIVLKKYRTGNALLRKSEQQWYTKAKQWQKGKRG